MENTFDLFRNKLSEIFQMDRAELDFGIYRIMNIKRTEMENYLNGDLLPQVEEVLRGVEDESIHDVQEELAKLEQSVSDAGMDPGASPKVRELRARLASTTDSDELKQRSFSHLLTFFSRYYDKGDFISKRRYKNDTYMIPYNGEEVKLVWANMDQYYIKTSEYLRDYRFFLDPEKRYRMSFKLVDADTERDNIKGKNRIFELQSDDPVALSDDGLVAYFSYDLSDRKQADALADAARIILKQAGKFQPYLEKEVETSAKASGKKPTLLQKHLSGYTRRNSEDYFIHKDLGGFLTRELDFFLKNEVLKVDELIDDSSATLQHQIHLARAIKQVGEKIIAMLHQIESSQKKLWLKKKFVTGTDYLVTLDRIINSVPELLPEIAANTEQLDEWKRLFAVDEIEDEPGHLPGVASPAFAEPVTEEFLKENANLVVDTRFFDEEFKWRLLQATEDIDEQTDGLLVHSENFQALQLMQERYREKVKCIYIDPPYNTGDSKILYKNEYDSAAWITMMQNRIGKSNRLLSDDFVYFIAIDDYEMAPLCQMIDTGFPLFRREMIVVNHHPQGGKGTTLANTHEYMLTIVDVRSDRVLVGREIDDGAELRQYQRSGTAESNFRMYRENSFFAILVDPRSLDVVGIEPPPGLSKHYPTEDTNEGYKRIYPIGTGGTERVWRNSYRTALRLHAEGKLISTDRFTIKQRIEHGEKKAALFSNWTDPRYNAGTYGANLLRDIIGPTNPFSYPKSIKTVEDAVFTFEDLSDGVALDFFAGSGTTGHAVINLNREDDGNRKYILVEMGEYFDTVLKPRIAKVVYSTDWKDGKPQSRSTGISHMVKYIRLESYEDTLNNLQVTERGRYSELLENGVEREFREGYMLGYMLDWEAGAAGLSVDAFRKPFDYYLNVATETLGESKPTQVDLVETFNYLVGLTVESIYTVAGCRVVEGHDSAGDHVLMVWRDLEKTDNEALNELFRKQRISIRDREFDLIYVNGDNNLENIKRPDETWKVRLIEHEFMTRMFDVADV